MRGVDSLQKMPNGCFQAHTPKGSTWPIPGIRYSEVIATKLPLANNTAEVKLNMPFGES